MSICIKEPCRVRLRCGGELDINRIDMTACYGACHDGPGDSRLCWLPCGRYSTPGADHPFDIIEVLAPLKPVVIDSAGDYWVVSERLNERRICQVVDVDSSAFPWVATDRSGYRQAFNAYGVSPDPIDDKHIVAKVAYRQRPLTPDEAFKLLGKKVREKGIPGTAEISFVGSTVAIIGTNTRISYQRLAADLELEDGTPLSVTEPIPFAG